MEWSASELQAMVNSGSAWRMEGSFGRSVMDMIRGGLLMLGHKGVRDYWGNYVPSRHEVTPGMIGSYEYVESQIGSSAAQALSEVE